MKSLLSVFTAFGLLCAVPSTTEGHDTVTIVKTTRVDTVVPIPAWNEHRTIMPYRAPSYIPRYRPIEKMPYPRRYRYHFRPHLYIGPHDGGGFGGDFGLQFGTPFLKPHGFGFGLKFF